MIQIDILKVMDMIEKTFENPADRWQMLRELLKIQKEAQNKKHKIGRPRKAEKSGRGN